MKTVRLKTSIFLCLIAGAALAFTGIACQRTDTNINTNSNLMSNVNTSPVNTNSTPESLSVIAAREPEKYKATLILSAETEGGEKTVGIPSLTANVARNGPDRRLSFKLPDGSDLIYLEMGGKPIVIFPSRKQYAELTPEATGFQLGRLMTPGQLVSRLETLKGVERVGEETLNGRLAQKYRYANTTNTNTQAGSVSTEAFVYVDKDTGLPLRSELFTETSGNVQGVKGAKVVAEMRDISTDVDPLLFQVPTEYAKVPPQQIRQHIDALTNMAAALIRSLMTNANAQASPTMTTSPAITTSPAR